MKSPPFSSLQDERTRSLTGVLAIVFLAITQVALLGAILYRRYYLGLPEASYADLRWILGGSVFGFIALRLVTGAMVPQLNRRWLALIYLGCVLGLGSILTLWKGWPPVSQWHVTLLPVVVGPAVLLGAYYALGVYGQRKLERMLGEDDE